MKSLFALRIISALPQLRQFHLDIHDCPSVNYQGLMYIVRALDSMPYLTGISFVLSLYSDITGSMLAEFGITLGRISFLEHLNLIINFKDVLTKDVKTFFSEGLTQLPNLTKMNLGFGTCSVINGEMIEIIGDGLVKMRHL